jgi:hypothetical protein
MKCLVRRSVAVVASAATLMFLMTGGFPLGAQESSAAKSQTSKGKQAGASSSTSAPAPPDVTHRVPPGYAKLGLTEQQKERIYRIQAEYYPKIQALEKQVDDLRERRERAFEAVLNTAQKRTLADAEQKKKAAAQAKKAAAEKASEKEKAGN